MNSAQPPTSNASAPPQLAPGDVPRSYELAVRLHREGKLREANALYGEILRCVPNHAAALHMMGTGCLQLGEVQTGMALIQRSIEIDPSQAAAYCALGNALRALNRPLEALELCDKALTLDPCYAPALNNRGSALFDLGRLSEAVESYASALRLRPRNVGAQLNHANALCQLGQLPAALASYDQVLRLDPSSVPALHASGKLLWELGRHDEALQRLTRCLALNPNHSDAHYQRGGVLQELGQLEEALRSYDAALHLDATCIPAHSNKAAILHQLGQYEAAAASYRKVLERAPDFPYAVGGQMYSRLMQCDWSHWQHDIVRVNAAVNNSIPAIVPFGLLAVCNSPATQQRCAQSCVHHSFPAAAAPVWRGERYAHDRIRVAYLSADFREHPVSQLLAGVLEKHDRKRFEVLAVSLASPDNSDLGRRIRTAAEVFMDASRESDAAVAQTLRQHEVDIVIDLQGFTLGTRARILAHRAAPTQVNYLGFPATMGAGYIDYIIADEIVIPEDAEEHYSEKVVRLPHCYLPFDDSQPIAAITPTRAEAGLPASGFVFCAFNNHYKINPPLFDVWMRLLRETPGSCLWLRAANPTVIRNLLAEAKARKIEAERLVFAPSLPAIEDHLARQRLANLFLDTLPYNAHATAANALWAGVPVLTCIGTSFAGRVGASALHALGLPELVARDLEDYERIALELAHSPERLEAIRMALTEARSTAPFFQTDRYRQDLEAALLHMWEQRQKG